MPTGIMCSCAHHVIVVRQCYLNLCESCNRFGCMEPSSQEVCGDRKIEAMMQSVLGVFNHSLSIKLGIFCISPANCVSQWHTGLKTPQLA